MEQRLLQILPKCKTLTQLKQCHLQFIRHRLQSTPQVLPKLLDLASGFRSLRYAVRIFDNAKAPNVVAFNTLIKCFNENGFPNRSFSAYIRMRGSGQPPNNFTFTFILKACEYIDSSNGSEPIHAEIVKWGFGSDVFVQNTLLHAYSKCNKELGFARKVFDEMRVRDAVSWSSMMGAYLVHGDIGGAMQLFDVTPERSVVSGNSMITGLCKAGDMASAKQVFDGMKARDAFSWNAMITGYVVNRDVESARSIFDRMEGKDVVSWTAMLSGYTKMGDLESAEKLFDRMPVKNVVSWNAMIAGYNENSQFDQALGVFQRMLFDGKFQPDEGTLVAVVTACAYLGVLENGGWVHSYMKRNKVHLTTTLGNALIEMFAKCGDIKSSQSVFDQMTHKSIITWTTIISGLGMHGQCRQALALFERMCKEGMKPDDIIFVAVLTACSHGGLVEEGRRIFNRMAGQYDIKPRLEHYGCIVDLLSRAGKLEEAFQFIQNMPIEPGIEIWANLLSFCTMSGAQDLVEFVRKKIVDLKPTDPAYRVLVSNLNAREGSWEGVVGIRTRMRHDGIEKVPGSSLIQVGGEVYEFLAIDLRHERKKEIYEALDGLTRVMKKVGDTSLEKSTYPTA